MVSQLRMYKVKAGALEAFVREWRAGVVPLRRKFGFKVEGAWALPERNEFVWILAYDGPEGFEARDAAYYASPERKALTPDPARHLTQIDTRLMRSVLP
ncbi:MAG TPA: NIPSNAP family protein [Thermoplasmata archaeon]|nr:NIPSNAP family protein [Thermoplasmata archaeon]